MAQSLSLRISPQPNHYAHTTKKNSPKQPENSFYKAVLGHFQAICTPSNGPKRIQTGPQLGGTYGPMSKLKKKPLTKSLGPFFRRNGPKQSEVRFFMLFWAISGLLRHPQLDPKKYRKPALVGRIYGQCMSLEMSS
jgi:hypothetical protein